MVFISRIRRTVRPAVKMLQAVARWRRLSFDDVPPIFGNAKPKSGSHLLLQVLAGFTRVLPYAYVEAEPIRTITKEGRRRRTSEILSDLKGLRQGIIGWGYLDPTPENISFLCRPGRLNYFIYRDPRDMLVSHVFFATDMYEDHGMHAYYRSLPDVGARLKVAITGIHKPDLMLVSVKQRYESVLKWLQQPQVLCIRFEDLINHSEVIIATMLEHFEKAGCQIPIPTEQAVSTLQNAIQPRKSATFRTGKTGGWRDYFTAEHKRIFMETAGNLLIELGYEKNNDW